METIVKKFSELTLQELYSILRLRVDVFVVEQECPYPELDGLDENALHIWMQDKDGIAAYLRVLAPGELFEEAAIGRVVSARRRRGLGTLILKEGIKAAKEVFGASAVRVEAQTYARRLYEKQGFLPASDPFLEDGIEHIEMLLKL